MAWYNRLETLCLTTMYNLNQEKDQRYKELGIRDKITLSSGRFLLGNKYVYLFLLIWYCECIIHISISFIHISINQIFQESSCLKMWRTPLWVPPNVFSKLFTHSPPPSPPQCTSEFPDSKCIRVSLINCQNWILKLWSWWKSGGGCLPCFATHFMPMMVVGKYWKGLIAISYRPKINPFFLLKGKNCHSF